MIIVNINLYIVNVEHTKLNKFFTRNMMHIELFTLIIFLYRARLLEKNYFYLLSFMKINREKLTLEKKKSFELD